MSSISCVSVERCFLNLCCASWRMLCLSRCCMMLLVIIVFEDLAGDGCE